MRVKLVRIGNSRGVRLPKPILEASGLTDEIDIAVEAGRVVLTPAARKPREGWAEAARRMVAKGTTPTRGKARRTSTLRTKRGGHGRTTIRGSMSPALDVFLVALDPVQGSETAKTHPCVVASPDELNDIVVREELPSR